MLDSSLSITADARGVASTAAVTEQENLSPIYVSGSSQGYTNNTGISVPATKPKTSISRLAFPFSAHRRKLVPPGPPSPPSSINARSVPEPPVRRKHVFISSPLRGPAQESASDTVSPPSDAVPTQSKPCTIHHGCSRHSLLLTKWVWSSRRAHYEAHSSPHQRPSGYGVATLPKKAQLPSLVPGNRRPRLHRIPSFYSEEKKPDQPPLTMYPRQGDISALRDPYCARADRSFSTVPLWTLRRILYLFAMHLPKPHTADQDADCASGDAFEDAGSEASFNTETESTLVGSDCDGSEWDSRSVSTACSSRHELGDDDITYGDFDTVGRNGVKGHNLLSLAARRVNREPDVCTVHMTSAGWLCRLYRDPRPEGIKLTMSEQPSAWDRSCRGSRNVGQQNMWPSNWYGMWELLIELAARDGPVESENMTPDATLKARAKIRPPQPKEFRWLKLLGGSKGTVKPVTPSPPASPAAVTNGDVVKRFGQVPSGGRQPVWLPLLEPSHPAAG